MSAVATHWLIFYMLLSSVYYNSKLNYKSPPLPVSPNHKSWLSPPRACHCALACKVPLLFTRQQSGKNGPVFFGLSYGPVMGTVYIGPVKNGEFVLPLSKRKADTLLDKMWSVENRLWVSFLIWMIIYSGPVLWMLPCAKCLFTTKIKKWFASFIFCSDEYNEISPKKKKMWLKQN